MEQLQIIGHKHVERTRSIKFCAIVYKIYDR